MILAILMLGPKAFDDGGEPREAALVDSACSDNPEIRDQALGDIYEAYKRLVFKVCWHITQDHNLSEDLTQETFIRAFNNIAEAKPKKLRGWLCAIARNVALDKQRHGRVVISKIAMLREDGIQSRGNPEAVVSLKLDTDKVKATFKLCASRLERSQALLLERRLLGHSLAMIARIYSLKRKELKRLNDNLRYQIEKCMKSHGFPSFRLKDYLAYEES